MDTRNPLPVFCTSPFCYLFVKFDYRLENFLSLIVTMLNDGAFLRFMPEKRKRIVSGDSPCFNPETVANIFGMQAFYSTLFLQSA